MSRQPIPPLFDMAAPAGDSPPVPSARCPVPPPPDLSDLIGLPYEKMDCWELMAVALRRFGVEVPEVPAGLLARAYLSPLAVELEPGEGCKAGDVLDVIGDPDHVGVCVDAFDFIHAMRDVGSRKDSIAAWQRLGRIRRRLRPVVLVVDGGRPCMPPAPRGPDRRSDRDPSGGGA